MSGFAPLGDKLQRDAIVAPAFSRRLRAVVENVAMVAAAARAMILGARQNEFEIRAGVEAAGMVVKKLGQPVPLSYFISEVNSGKPQPAHAKTPGRFSLLSGLEPERSVPSSRKMLNCLAANVCAIPLSII